MPNVNQPTQRTQTTLFPALRLRVNRDKSVRNRHPWIFSGAIADWPNCLEAGGLAAVVADNGDHLGYAYVNRRCSLAARMVSFGDTEPHAAIREHLARAVALRHRHFNPDQTNAVRLVNSEGDNLPGLIVDQYADVLVVQISTLGMERLKPLVLETLVELVKPRAVYEKSDVAARYEEGLTDVVGLLHGRDFGPLIVTENGLRFHVDIKRGQKTGLFLDQRDMRALLETLSAGRRILNGFAYTGGFSVYARRGGARQVVSVDSSDGALKLAQANVSLNGFSTALDDFIEADMFAYLRTTDTGAFDVIILDPPAFARKKEDVLRAGRAYKDLNRLAIANVAPGGLVLTCSCSHFVDEKLFGQIVFQAAGETGRQVRVLHRHRQAFDHPVSIFHPEGSYLKSLLLSVDD
ncbi:MAG: class I SAM-dependent rRNA methyltransferase [Chloracidobacterium sp.]|uniref:Class I SAM-dependent rRNA methyltransferase n=1 Tax=Chloracidobacterium validum TaxID=2821543 RepID=A0ABX8B8G5_9BACT|nr:class I SAM-dependent rRNA methyltransferase [Chloracidobacterium validum]QUW02956.1 class I SAM-dependent rRNA methyltransferase [Chloracidobacterium validum]